MAHNEQIKYCQKIKNKFSDMFIEKNVLDVGSLDVNGNNRYLFSGGSYTGIDVAPGKNVDIVTPAHLYDGKSNFYDVIISTECFEHDMYYNFTIKNIIRMLKSNGLFLFTCATTGRPEHGTRRSEPQAAPLLNNIPEWSDYYKNLTENDIKLIDNFDYVFKEYKFEVNLIGSCDLYFYGIKK